jgi:UDP-sugar transporter A1/2/3
MAVPAALYSIQMTLEYVALGNLDAAVFSVLVQTKLLATAGCAVLILRKKIKKVQLISLVLLTVGVMLCNMKDFNRSSSSVSGGRRLGEEGMDTTKGIIATLSIAACSGFASVYTEKVIKAKRTITSRREEELPLNQLQTPQPQYGLVYTQVQLAFVSLVIMGFYCVIMELEEITQKGLWYGFNFPAYVSIFVSAIGGLTVAAVLKYADAVLKGYATAVSVILTGCLSMILFDTKLNILYFLGIGNVICAVLLYSATDLDRLLC